jgi:uncharacterized protein YceK
MKKIAVTIVPLALLLSGCASVPCGDGKSYNFALIKINMNLALYKSSASSADAGRDIVQSTKVNSEGDDTLDIPLSLAAHGANVTAAAADGECVHSTNFNPLPLKLNIGLWKSCAQSSSSGGTVSQTNDVSSKGEAKVDI